MIKNWEVDRGILWIKNKDGKTVSDRLITTFEHELEIGEWLGMPNALSDNIALLVKELRKLNEERNDRTSGGF